ncbi:MAG TPA: PAS domain-containing protein [Brevundimonas sp.]|jgi:hypothetical protein|uniref:PAS domain-containing protein n=1 Tax=Brevundimonas sp. TaxID=1871086 RepID=UPI002DE5B0FF|nr:PAS domain-containing protein [Brevundimonas sp.]
MMFHSDTRALIDLWSGLSRGDGARSGLPHRAALMPEALGRGLTRAFLAERTGDDARIRLAGDWLEAFHHGPLTGSGVLSLWRHASRPLVADALRRTVREARPVVIAATAGPLNLEVTLTPFRGDAGGRELILGLYSRASGPAPAARTPHRLTAQVCVGVGDPGRPRLALAALDGRRIA